MKLLDRLVAGIDARIVRLLIWAGFVLTVVGLLPLGYSYIGPVEMGTIYLLGLPFEASYGFFQSLMVAKLLAQSLGAGLFMLGSALVLRALERPRAPSRYHFALMVSGAFLFTAALFLLNYMSLTWYETWLGVQAGTETWYAMMSSLEITALFLYAIGAFLSFRTLLRGLELDWSYGRYVMVAAIVVTALAAVAPLLSAHLVYGWPVRSLDLMFVLSTPLLLIGGALSWRAVLRKDAGGPLFRSFMWIGIALLAAGTLSYALAIALLGVLDLSVLTWAFELAFMRLIGEVMVMAACAYLAVKGARAAPSERDDGATPAAPC